ncbi:Conserved_hypothetical protein [Hexamita inflata]|uniref:Uncharacterized protein n=1 Tax=Hexamita inflata TaxID=28002 RepID=A0AA86R6C9_9EUKA|nr:Conserved hypothetical protein [Hexamita inflata]CAI9962765.1 Conserved hypothetical protein [Hexamita inflata]
MNLLQSTMFGVQEAGFQFIQNLQNMTKQIYETALRQKSQFVNPVEFLIDSGIIIKKMSQERAKQILNVTDKADLDQHYKQIREQNFISPYLQCKIDCAYQALK